MKAIVSSRWVLAGVVAVAGVASVRLAAVWLLPGAHARIAKVHLDAIAGLPEARAARLVSQLAEQDEWVDVIVAAIEDQRTEVAEQAERSLRKIVTRWSEQPSDLIASRVERLAEGLVVTARKLPSERRSVPRALAQRILGWHVESRGGDAARIIANCEAVLLLPAVEPVELRVATASDVREPVINAPEVPLEVPPVVQTPPEAAVIISHPVIAPPGAEQRDPNEPGRFVAPRAVRIGDD